MKTKLIATIAMIVTTASLFALSANDSATIIKKATDKAIKAGDYAEIYTMLEELKTADAKTKAKVLNAMQSAFNSTRLTAYTSMAAKTMNASNLVKIEKTAGGKWNVVMPYNVKADIPRGAVEKPTLSTNPVANKR